MTGLGHGVPPGARVRARACSSFRVVVVLAFAVASSRGVVTHHCGGGTVEDNEGKYVVHPDEEIEFVSNPPAGGEPVPWLDAVLGDAAARKQAFCSFQLCIL